VSPGHCQREVNQAGNRGRESAGRWWASDVSIPRQCMQKVSDIVAINITLQVNGESALFILLAEDGTLNRLGTGSAQNQEHDMFIGVTGEPIFSYLLSE